MRTKLLSWIMFLMCLMGGTSALFAQTVYVNSSTGNDATGTGTSVSPYKTFSKGYAMVSAGGTLDLTGTFTWTNAGETATGYTIAKNITIQGQGANQTIVQAATSPGGNAAGIFTVSNGTSGGTSLNVTIKNLEIRYGYLTATSSVGGGIAISYATVTISNCYIDHNQAGQGSAINANSSNLIINNSTISNNVVLNGSSGGGAICLGTGSNQSFGITITNSTVCYNSGASWGGGIAATYGVHYVTNCTIAYNSCTSTSDGGGGISVGGGDIGGPVGTMYIKNSIVTNNTNSTTADDYDDAYGGSTINNGDNIIGTSDSPTLITTGNQASLNLSSTLAANGTINGTPTLAISAGSVAINAGSSVANGTVAIPTTDERGFNRVGAVDIGAYEYGASAPVPTVTGISPTNGPSAGGTSVTITGTNLTAATSVKFGNTAGTITANTATSITATSPAGSAGTVDVTVTTTSGTSATSSSDQFTYVAAPTVTGISPTGGPTSGGTSVTITGTNLTSASAVKFGNTAGTITANSANSITATSPSGTAGAVDITVTTVGGTSGTSSSDQFTYQIVTGLTTPSTSSITLYPNPTSDVFYLTGVESGMIAIYDLSGRLLQTSRIEGKTAVNVSSLRQGVYMVQISGDNGIVEKKLVKK